MVGELAVWTGLFEEMDAEKKKTAFDFVLSLVRGGEEAEQVIDRVLLDEFYAEDDGERFTVEELRAEYGL